MKRIVLVLALLFAVQTVWAADMSNKVGFGIGQAIPGGELLSPSYFTMRVGLMPGMVLAPELFLLMVSEDSKVDTVKTSQSNIGLGIGVLFRVLGTNTTNLYGIGGFGFEMDKATTEDYSEGNPSKLTSSQSAFGLDLGLGLEHFVTNTLAVNLNTLSGLSKYSSKTEQEVGPTTTTLVERSGLSFGLKNIDCKLYVIWYVPFM